MRKLKQNHSTSLLSYLGDTLSIIRYKLAGFKGRKSCVGKLTGEIIQLK
jgi:hypothetical protein